MAITPRLDLRQSQSLVMTPQLQQAIKLLQLNNIELTEYVETELEQNPLLERDEGQTDNQRETDRNREEAATPENDAVGADTPDGPDSGDFTSSDALPSEGDAPLDATYENVYDGDGIVDVAGEVPGAFADGRGGRGGFDDLDGGFEATLASDKDLRQHLVEQLTIEVEDPVDKMIGIYLIDSLDESGWLTENLDVIAETLDCPLERIESVLDVLQSFDPTGIFARNLAECLALQLQELDRLDPAMQALLENLDLLSVQDLPALKKVCGVDAEDLAEMLMEIRALNPKPATVYEHEIAQTVIPDILMRADADGGWLLELNPDTLPRVLVNNRYFSRINKQAQSKRDKEYISEQYQSANWLVKSLDQRANTILKVSTEIVKQQDAFFRKGVEFLRPLVLRDIAEAIEMHESTVSRVTTNKYMMTPRGIFELKYFFTSSIANAEGGEAHSAEAVRYRIKSLIDNEERDNIFSDDRIVEILRESGIDIARRTVAKYRDSLKIPSSVQRRRQKARAL